MSIQAPPPTDAGQGLILDNSRSLLAASASLKASLAKGQQQYQTPPEWARRFTRQLPCNRPRTAVDWQCAAGHLVAPLHQCDYLWGIDVDKRHADTIPPGTRMNRIVDSCLPVWDALLQFFPAVRFECQVVNPPFGLPWLAPDFRMGRATSTAVTWKRVRQLAAEGGYGYFIGGRGQLEALKIHEHPWAYLYQTFPSGFFPNTDIAIGVVHWINGAIPNRIAQEFKTLNHDEHPVLPPELNGILRDPVQDWDKGYELHEAMREIQEMLVEERRAIPPYNFFLRNNVLAVNFTTRFRLTNKLERADLVRLAAIEGQHPLALVHEVQTRRLLREVIERGIFTISDGAHIAIQEALVEAAKLATPIMPVTDFERVAYVDELDQLTVRDDFDPAFYQWQLRFTPGIKYSHSTGTYTFVDSFTRKRIHYSEEEERTYTLDHHCTLTGQDRYVSVRDNSGMEHRFMDRPDRTRTQWREHAENLLWHIFVKPPVPTVAEDLLAKVDHARGRLLALAQTMRG